MLDSLQCFIHAKRDTRKYRKLRLQLVPFISPCSYRPNLPVNKILHPIMSFPGYLPLV